MDNIANSSRRLLQVFSDGGMDGRYEPSYVSTHASGILIWLNCKYFFLTARHCLHAFRDANGNEIDFRDLQNHSPFWINKSDKFNEIDNTLDFLYARKIWFIGENINEQPEYEVDLKDICLLELYYPMQRIENYVNLNDLDTIIQDKSELRNSHMGFSGYPAEKNPYFYEQNDIAPIRGDATHSTLFRRWYDFGTNIKDSNTINLLKPRDFEYSGMCGGVVFSINNSVCKWAGMYISGSKTTARYLPSYLILDSILNYRQSRFIIVDIDAETCGSAKHISNAEYREHVTRMERFFEETPFDEK